MLELIRYTREQKSAWNEFAARAKNGVFLFDRAYMDYHADRFVDHSLLALADGRLTALFPASRRDDTLASHGGLTFGGFVTDERIHAAGMLELFDRLREHARAEGIARIVYKPAPHIYHRVPAEEDLYALFRCEGRLIRRDLASVIDRTGPVAPSKGRKSSIKKSKSSGLVVRRSDDIEAFMEMERLRLEEKYATRPTHAAAEMRLLADRFPDNIKLFAAYRGEEMLAGAIVYESPRVAHAQYIASTAEGRELGAVDAVIDHLLGEVYADTPYFDFGISTENQGQVLNLGLIANKESYGARAIAYDWYELKVA